MAAKRLLVYWYDNFQGQKKEQDEYLT